MHSYLLEMLECPACHGDLTWTILECDDQRILSAHIRCETCEATYAVRDGIGLFLTPDLPRDDLWQQMDSGLMQYLRQHPEVDRQLMETPLETLNPADQFFRALVLEERGHYAAAKTIEEAAFAGLYTPEYRTCWNRQIDYVVEQLVAGDDPIVDVASGRCYLVEQLARRSKRPIVASDFSPRVLQQDRRRLQAFGLYERISLLAFDARRTPFKSGAIKTLTTNLGLPNLREPGDVLGELGRITTGMFFAISHFFSDDDEVNATQIRASGSASLLFRSTTLESFADAGWQVKVVNACQGIARPTPSGVILEGAGIDAWPIAETTLEWCVLAATQEKHPH